MEINRTLAAELAEAVDAQPKECFRNSVMALFADRDLDAVYVEGILAIWDGRMLIDHGWLEVAEQIVDVTLDDCSAQDYTPVFRYTRAEIQATVRRRTTLPLYAAQAVRRRRMSDMLYNLYQTFVEPGEGHECVDRCEDAGQ